MILKFVCHELLVSGSWHTLAQVRTEDTCHFYELDSLLVIYGAAELPLSKAVSSQRCVLQEPVVQMG